MLARATKLIKDIFLWPNTEGVIHERCWSALEMKRKNVISSVLLFIPLAVSAAPQTVSGGVHFVGQIVNSGCAVSHTGPAQFAESQRIQVASGLDLDVDAYRNVCSHGPIPFSTAFESLKADEASVDSTPEKGVVTVTYL
ncbi:hypothetical protein EMIT0P253_60044 [Pseudomonas sp. IT-P253]